MGIFVNPILYLLECIVPDVEFVTKVTILVRVNVWARVNFSRINVKRITLSVQFSFIIRIQARDVVAFHKITGLVCNTVEKTDNLFKYIIKYSITRCHSIYARPTKKLSNRVIFFDKFHVCKVLRYTGIM